MRGSIVIALSGLLGALGVAAAAYAAHGGDARLAGTAAGICLVHAPALLAIGLAAERSRLLIVTAALWTAGVLFFSGDLMVRALLNPQPVLATAPLGGLLLVLGWLSLVVAAFRLARR